MRGERDSNRFRCLKCNRRLDQWGRCKRRHCSSYIALWKRDQNERLQVNIAGLSEVRLGSITAPGAQALPWDERYCLWLGPHAHSGDLGCRVVPDRALAFNRRAPRLWSKLHRVAATRARRGSGQFQFFARVWEVQGRGVLHVHPVVGCSTPAQQAGADEYFETLRERAPSYGFGYSCKETVMSGEEAAGYLGKNLRETALTTGAPGQIVWISQDLTKVTGCTGRTLRQRRGEYRTMQGPK
jgi:hypothetical protein